MMVGPKGQFLSRFIVAEGVDLLQGAASVSCCGPQTLRNRQTAGVCAPPPFEAPQSPLHVSGNIG